MRNLMYAYCIVFISIISINKSSAQYLYVKEKSGVQSIFDFNNLQKIYFSSGSINFQKKSGYDDSFEFRDLNKMYFRNINPIKEVNGQNIFPFFIFPNPASDILHINLSGNIIKYYRIEILNLDGRILKSIDETDIKDISVNIADLNNGLYVCRLVNDKKIHMLTFIKN